MSETLEIIFLFVILVFGIIGTGYIGYVFYKYETTTDLYWMDMMFICAIGAFIPVGALAFSVLTLIQKL